VVSPKDGWGWPRRLSPGRGGVGRGPCTAATSRDVKEQPKNRRSGEPKNDRRTEDRVNRRTDFGAEVPSVLDRPPSANKAQMWGTDGTEHSGTNAAAPTGGAAGWTVSRTIVNDRVKGVGGWG
jgi:hypothetical protein